MKRVLFGSVALLALSGAASAADIPVKMPVKAAPVVSYNWTGFYLGGYYSESISHTKATTSVTRGTAQVNDTRIGAGLTAGYNWQFDPHWLAGFEADVGSLGINRTEQDWDDTPLVGTKANWYGTARGRFGYVTGPSVLYATGGAAFVHMTETFGNTPTESSTTRTGWTAGAGIESKISHNWSTKTEYLYINAGSNNFSANVFGATQVATFENRFHVIKTGLNYQFGAGANDGIFSIFTAPPLPSDHNWTGLYVGVNAGIGITNAQAPGGEGAVPFGTETDQNAVGFAGGGQIGYNYVFGGKWLVGVEGDFGALSLSSAIPEWNDTGRTFSTKTNWYGTARGRFGVSTGPALLYFTAGGAWVRLSDGITILGGGNDVAAKTKGGWTLGGGTEVALDARWSARLEMLYMDVGHTQHAVGAVNADFKERFTVVRAGVNYKLGN